MQKSAKARSEVRFMVVMGLQIFLLCIFSALANAQGSLSQNAVYNSTGGVAGSSGFIDASVLGTAGSTICSVLYNLLSGATTVPYPSTGAVIDARGVPGAGINMTCALNSTPWTSGLGSPLTVPSTILLPAGTIVIQNTWVLPANTRLIGEGDGIAPLTITNAPGTTIQASVSSFASGSNMIQFGSSSGCCTGISVEDLVLDGVGLTVNGIVNQYAEDFSYVDHVGLYRIRGTGLLVEGSANGSGPYSNITFDTGGYSGTSTTVCASINGTTNTHGIHGLSCTSETHDAPAAVLLDASNNSIEDVRVVGFYDGILIGSNVNAKSNVLSNIIGDTTNGGTSLTPINTIHISNAHTVADLSIMGVSNIGGLGTYSIQDDISGPHLTDTSVALYALGEAGSIGYSRYSTSPNVPTWAVGSGYPTGTTCVRGSLYSCIGGSTACTNGSTAALWACVLTSGGSVQWQPVK